MTNFKKIVACGAVMAISVSPLTALAQDDVDDLLKDLEEETAKPAAPAVADAPKAEEHHDASHGGARAILVATPTCPNGRIACPYLDKAGFKYEKLMADENAELALSYGVKQAPTLVVTNGTDFEKYAGAPAIKQYRAQ